MINSTSDQVFIPSNSQNYCPNIVPSSSKIQKAKSSGFQIINAFHSKSDSHNKLNEILLTDQNVDINNIPKLIINTTQLFTGDYNNAYSSRNNKLPTIMDYQSKLSSTQRIHQLSENFTFFNTKILDNKTNYYTPRVERFKKKISNTSSSINKEKNGQCL